MSGKPPPDSIRVLPILISFCRASSQNGRRGEAAGVYYFKIEKQTKNKIMKTEIENILNEAAHSFNVLVAYDNIRSGIGAKVFCDRFSQQLGTARKLQLGLWSFSALQRRQLAELAAVEAGQTDLLIVAVSGDAELPRPLKSWISHSLRRIRARDGILVAQVHGILKMDQEMSPAYACLKHLAEDAGVRFFAEAVEAAEDELDSSLGSVHRRAQMRTSLLDAILQLPPTETLTRDLL
jgi:hypothetical protein